VREGEERGMEGEEREGDGRGKIRSQNIFV